MGTQIQLLLQKYTGMAKSTIFMSGLAILELPKELDFWRGNEIVVLAF